MEEVIKNSYAAATSFFRIANLHAALQRGKTRDITLERHNFAVRDVARRRAAKRTNEFGVRVIQQLLFREYSRRFLPSRNVRHLSPSSLGLKIQPKPETDLATSVASIGLIQDVWKRRCASFLASDWSLLSLRGQTQFSERRFVSVRIARTTNRFGAAPIKLKG